VPQAWFAKTPLDRYIVPPPELPQSTIFLCAGSEFLIQAVVGAETSELTL
jgi:hypothetical protein